MDSKLQQEQGAKALLAAGEIFDARYKIVALLAKGGMGELYHAIDQELQREVVIKFLRNEICSSNESRQRFLKEAKALASLEHGNIVKLYRFGIDEWDEPFLVMEYVHGETLADELARTGRLTPEKFLLVFTEVLNGLAHAHENKIVHRDLKPANIMLGAESKPSKIIDFGIAKILVSEAADKADLTRTSVLVGTPAYMSPEQCKKEKGSKASDIYSLACIMFESLTGNPPFSGDSAFEIMYKHMSETPPRLLAFARTEKEKTLAALIDRCLEKDPLRRPQSVEEILSVFKELLVADLAAFEPVQKKRSSIGMVIAGIVALNVVLLVVLFNMPARKTAQEIKLGRGVQSEIAREIARLIPLTKKAEDLFWTSTNPERKDQTGPQLMNLFQELANKQIESANWADVESVYKTMEREEKVCRGMTQKNKMEGRLASCHDLKAKAALKQGNFDRAKAEFADCEKIVLQVWGEQSKAWEDLLMERSILNLRMRNFDAVIKDFKNTLTLWDGENLESWVLYDQVLDKYGPSRPLLVANCYEEARKITPKNEKETEQLFEIFYMLAHELRQIGRYDRMGGRAAVHARKMFERLPHPTDAQKEAIRRLLEECAGYLDED